MVRKRPVPRNQERQAGLVVPKSRLGSRRAPAAGTGLVDGFKPALPKPKAQLLDLSEAANLAAAQEQQRRDAGL